ncbi:N-formylglutamate deformylase [Leptolyngbya sp. FACHB-261]|uniref:N-formylglutamate deformylase n=1 Tax=Leptolyngbya sp. FACHB-261 TaxID=2692806 RepID=UPI00168356AB|nr:N-formylglutamate deformylase [Leptolyngbya sp. FACHB-261]MBD2104844.1 N-formylglutamate deformylase [Leptolyngbya sp. FACHB-261]
MEIYRFHKGTTPLLISMPHVGTFVPNHIEERLTKQARVLPDTDWHIARLYDFAADLGVSLIAANYSRYVVDLNRPPDNTPLYPGAANTELCPTTLFDGSPIYSEGELPDSEEIRERREQYWQPYHNQIQTELSRLKTTHGVALLWDAHSICSHVPRLFAGRLPDLSLGTNSGLSAAPELAKRLLAIAESADDYTAVLDGRFKGGYITRHYGRPDAGIHAVQLELVWATYMQEVAPFSFEEERAASIRPVLRRLLESALNWAEETQPVAVPESLL